MDHPVLENFNRRIQSDKVDLEKAANALQITRDETGVEYTDVCLIYTELLKTWVTNSRFGTV